VDNLLVREVGKLALPAAQPVGRRHDPRQPANNAVVIDEEATGWFRGVLGERRVAEILEALGPAWTVLHSVPVGRGTSDIGHVVVGPPIGQGISPRVRGFIGL